MSFLTVLLMLWICQAATGYYESEHRLYATLLQDYVSIVRPTKEQSQPLELQMDVELQERISLKNSNTLQLELFLTTEWEDFRLRWNPEDFEGINTLRIQASDLWLPDIVLVNAVERPPRQHAGDHVLVYHNGKMLHVRKLSTTTHCQLRRNVDTQNCSLSFLSWTYSGNDLDLKVKGSNDMKPVTFHGEDTDSAWQLKEAVLERSVSHYACCPEPYPKVTLKLQIKKSSQE